MTEPSSRAGDPRWGQEGREAKAEAILKTMQLHTGQALTDAVWLDIGCGSGGIAATLAGHVRRVVGVDPERWERWDAFRAAHANLAFHEGSYRDIERLLGAESIDVVVCNQVYEHVDDPLALLQSIHRVLKPGGLCYFAGPNLLWPIEPHVFWPFVHWLPRRFAQGIMRSLGSRRALELDAYSTHYWRLTRWFRESNLAPTTVVSARLASELLVRGWSIPLPRPLGGMIDLLASLLPGFVFALQKPSAA